ncbi:hypothetical protein [Halobacillus mangrovi]
MAQFYVNQNQQTGGDHEVHKEGCKFMPFEKICSPLAVIPIAQVH